ncbi:MAG: IclR family transcriptional regulator [Trueperaceae bacterium]
MGTVAVLDKAILVLEAMDRLAKPLALRDIAEATGLPKATVHRILHTLHGRGYVAQDDLAGAYRLTPRLAALGRAGQTSGLIARAEPFLERLHATFDETTNLGVLEDDRVVYLRSIETTRPLRWIVQPGSSDAFYSTALGRAVAAFLPDRERESLLALGPFEARTPDTPTDPKRLRSILEEVRARGWALDDQHNDSGVACVAVPLLDDDRPVAAISVAVPHNRLDENRLKSLVPELLAVAADWQSGDASAGDRPAPTAHPRT